MMKKLLLGVLWGIAMIAHTQDVVDPPLELRQSRDGKILYIKRVIHHIAKDHTEQHLTFNKIDKNTGKTEACSEEEFLKGRVISEKKAMSFLYQLDHIPCVDEHFERD